MDALSLQPIFDAIARYAHSNEWVTYKEIRRAIPVSVYPKSAKWKRIILSSLDQLASSREPYVRRKLVNDYEYWYGLTPKGYELAKRRLKRV